MTLDVGNRAPDSTGAPDAASELVVVRPVVPGVAGEVDTETRHRLRRTLHILLAARRRDEGGGRSNG